MKRTGYAVKKKEKEKKTIKSSIHVQLLHVLCIETKNKQNMRNKTPTNHGRSHLLLKDTLSCLLHHYQNIYMNSTKSNH